MSKRRSSNEWHGLIEEQSESGLSQKAFCRQRGISVATFGYWKRKLQRESHTLPPGSGTDTVSLADWIELSTHGAGLGGGWQLELELGNGLCLRLRQG